MFILTPSWSACSRALAYYLELWSLIRLVHYYNNNHMLLHVATRTNSSHNCTVRRSASSGELSQCKLNGWACLPAPTFTQVTNHLKLLFSMLLLLWRRRSKTKVLCRCIQGGVQTVAWGMTRGEPKYYYHSRWWQRWFWLCLKIVGGVVGYDRLPGQQPDGQVDEARCQ